MRNQNQSGALLRRPGGAGVVPRQHGDGGIYAAPHLGEALRGRPDRLVRVPQPGLDAVHLPIRGGLQGAE